MTFKQKSLNSQYFKFYSQTVHDIGWSWKLLENTEYPGFDKWKCSWSKATINTRFTLAKWHGKPKNKEHIGGQISCKELFLKI